MQTEENHGQTLFNSYPESKLYQYKLSLDKIQSELIKFGLTRSQTKVFIYLGKYGSKTSPEVCKALKLPRTETYHILNVLMNRGIVVAEFCHPAKFSALPIEKAILKLVAAAQEKVNQMARKERELAKLWNEIPFFMVNSHEPKSEKFQMLQGMSRISNKMKEMIGKTKRECDLLCTSRDLSRFYYANLMEMATHFSPEINLLILPDPNIPDFVQKLLTDKIRIFPEKHVKNLCFLISDDSEVLIFLRNADYPTRDVFAFWTDSKSLIESMHLLFKYTWNISKPVQVNEVSIFTKESEMND